MNTKQAKEFLVQQMTEQAALDGVPLSDLEKRMMYFKESDASCASPLEPNEEFEAQYDTSEYETKLSRLLHHAHDRLKRDDLGKMREWNLAIRTPRRGDHYLLVLWDTKLPTEHPIRDFLKLVAVGMLIAVGIGIALEMVNNFDTGQSALVASGGVNFGWNNGAQGGGNVGLI
jgi:hypothetical protein